MKQNKIPRNEYIRKPVGKTNPYKHDVDYVSAMGYRDDSPFNDRPYIDIHTPSGMIDMSNTGIPLMANGMYLPPYSGMHQFEPGIVREQKIPMAQNGRIKTPEGWEKEIRAVENKIGDPSTWTLDSYKTLQDKLNEYKAWRENTAEGKAVVDYHNEPNEYVVPLPEQLKDSNMNYEKDLISKVLMNRNRDKDFVKRAYDVGAYPNSNMFTGLDTEDFGNRMSHKMSWGEDESGQAWMYPNIYNSNNEAIKIPNQYADYISSEGYKKATGIPVKKNGGGLLNKTLTCPSCGWSWKAVDGGKDIATCHKCGGTAKLAYGGDPSLANIEGHYPFGGQNSKTGTHFEEGGWLDQYQGDVEGSQVMPDEAVPGVNYFSLPEISVYPKPEKTFWNKIQESDFIKQIVDRLDKSTGGKDWYKDPSKGMGSALAEVVSLPFAAPQLAATYGLTGKVQTPSEAMNIENPYGAFAVDAILDPTNLLGAGLADDALKLSSKAANFTKKGTKALSTKAGNVDNMMSLETPKGNMYGENQVLTQQSRLLDPEIKAKFFKNQAQHVEPDFSKKGLFQSKFVKIPRDYGNRITPENYEEFVKKIHGSTDYGIAESTGFRSGNLGIGNYGNPGMVFKDAPLNNLGKDIINAHEKNHGIFAGTLSKEMEADLLKPFGTNKPIPNYASKHQGDEVLARMGQFKNAVGIGNNQVFTLGHLNLIRKNYANSFIDNGITAMLSKIKPGSKAEKGFLRNMNKYAFGITPAAIIGTEALQQEQNGGWLDAYDDEYRRGGQRRRRGTSKNIESSINDIFRRNYDVFGPAGKSRFNPRARYEEGGGLDQYQGAGQIKISDKRKIRKTTGKDINPNKDLKTGLYNKAVIDSIAENATRRGINPYQAVAMGLVESGLGKTDRNIGHVAMYDSTVSPYTQMMDNIVKSQAVAKRLNKTTPEEIIQAYNGYGKLFPTTEQDYHGFKTKSFYGVPIDEKGISLKENPLYGKEVLDIQKNVIEKNPAIKNIVTSYQYPRQGRPHIYTDYAKNWDEFMPKFPTNQLREPTEEDWEETDMKDPRKKMGGWLDKYNNF